MISERIQSKDKVLYQKEYSNFNLYKFNIKISKKNFKKLIKIIKIKLPL